jgi:hypothetical protein
VNTTYDKLFPQNLIISDTKRLNKSYKFKNEITASLVSSGNGTSRSSNE